MSRSARGTITEPGRNVAQKAGLNRSILDVGWGEYFRQLDYKTAYHGSVHVKVPAAYSSQECSACGHISSENRENQARFHCRNCKHTDHADTNAAMIVRGRGLPLISKTAGGTSAAVCGALSSAMVKKQKAKGATPKRSDASGKGSMPAPDAVRSPVLQGGE